MKQNRWQSYTLWIAIASFIALISKTYFNYEIPEFDAIVTSLLNIAVIVGIINNPTDKENL